MRNFAKKKIGKRFVVFYFYFLQQKYYRRNTFDHRKQRPVVGKQSSGKNKKVIMCQDNWLSDSNADQSDQKSKSDSIISHAAGTLSVLSGDSVDKKISENVWGDFESKENFINLHFC